ncbi:MAG: hypothetical protein ACR2N3_04400 [Pyrinomonadaceae bacterium]
MSENIKESARVLLSEIVDYAGLFPPSKLPMAEAVINYAAYKNSHYKWMLGRFVVPVEGLDEFAKNAQEFFLRGDDVWKLSVLAGAEIYETVRRIEEFNREFAGRAIADALEVKTHNSLEIENAAVHIPENFDAYFELPLNENLADAVSTLAVKNRRAKIRAGGITPESFPSAEQITRFMRTCLAANVPFKATAGLHHTLRCLKPLTYEKDAPVGTMNGFLNVFLAAAFLREGYKSDLIHELLEDEWAESFKFDETGITWRQEYFISTAQLKALRMRGAISFGSCSFDEPIADLQEMKIL